MDPQTLPVEAKNLYDNIQKEYPVGFEPLQLGDIRLNLLKITDIEPLLKGKDPLKNPSEFPFWVKLWESAMVLAEFLAGQKFEENTTLLDLGAGLGVPGLIAAAAGCNTTLTDYEEIILDFQRVSAAASKLDNVQFEMLDWLNPRDIGRYDIIIGAEILFREDFYQPLLDVMAQTLKPGGVIYLAHDINRQSLSPFLHKAQEFYNISASKRRLKSIEEDKFIMLHRLTAKV